MKDHRFGLAKGIFYKVFNFSIECGKLKLEKN